MDANILYPSRGADVLLSKAKALPANAEKLAAGLNKETADVIRAVFDIGFIEMLRRDRISAVLKPNGAPKHIGLYCTDKPSKQITTVTTEDFNDRNMAGRLYVTKGAAASAKKGNLLTLRVGPIEEDLLYENVMAMVLSRADPHTEYQVALYEPSSAATQPYTLAHSERVVLVYPGGIMTTIEPPEGTVIKVIRR